MLGTVRQLAAQDAVLWSDEGYRGITACIGGGGDAGGLRGFIGGFNFNILYQFHDRMSAGLDYNLNFGESTTNMDIYGEWRWQFNVKSSTVKPYLGAGVGASLNWNQDKWVGMALLPLIQAEVGFRVRLFGSWYLEPSARGGYPFIVGGQLLFGTSFPLRRKNADADNDNDDTTYYTNGGDSGDNDDGSYFDGTQQGGGDDNDGEEQYETIN
jgi:hypothetical protein